MKHRTPISRNAIALVLSLCLMTLSLTTSKVFAQEQFVIRTVADKKLTELPAGTLYWRLENFPTLAQAREAEGPTSMAAEVAGKVWLFTLGPKGSSSGGTGVAEVGPVPRIAATEYMIRITNSGGPPGAKTPVHSHPGAEAFYVLAGRMGQKTPNGVTYTEAGQSMNGHGADMPMEVFSAGTTNLDQLVMFLVDAAKPFAVPAKLE
jgi:hypothetical protein